MAAETTFLGGYKVGLISASLSAKSEKEGKKKKRDSSFLFDSGEVAQPTFIPVKKKVNINKILQIQYVAQFPDNEVYTVFTDLHYWYLQLYLNIGPWSVVNSNMHKFFRV